MKNVYIVVFCILIIIIFIQIIHLRSQINSTKTSIHKKSDIASKEAYYIAENNNDLRIYPLIINLNLCNKIYNEEDKISEFIKERINKISIYLLYICNLDVKSINVNINNLGVLVSENNNGSSSLKTDILGNKINTLIINNIVNKIIYDSQLEKGIQNYLNNYDVDIFILFSSKDCEIKDKTLLDTKSCVHDIIPFMGKTKKSASSQYLTDLNFHLFDYINENKKAIYTIGYNSK